MKRATHRRRRPPRQPRRQPREGHPGQRRSVSRRRSQWFWASWPLLGVAALAGSYVLVKPTLSPAPSLPQPWGLWVSTNTQSSASEYERPHLEPDWLLTLRIEAPAGCSSPATVTGAVQWEPKFLTDRIKPPTRLLLGVAGVHVIHAEISSPEPVGARPETRVVRG